MRLFAWGTGSGGAVDHQKRALFGADLIKQTLEPWDPCTAGRVFAAANDGRLGAPTRYIEGHGTQSSAHHEGVGGSEERMEQREKPSSFSGHGPVSSTKIPMHISNGMSLMNLVRQLRPQKEVEAVQEPTGRRQATKPSVQDAISIAKSRRFLRVVDKFKKKFFAKSSEKSRLCKRTD